MNYLWGAVNAISAPYQYYKDINPATLTGAIDVIVVRRPGSSGTMELVCSPFHVRFGKWQVLRPSEKKVVITVNGKAVPFNMKIGEAGEAFFVFETDIDVPDDLITSPLLEPTELVSPDRVPLGDFGRFGARDRRGSFTDGGISQEPDFLDLDAPSTPLSGEDSKAISSSNQPDSPDSSSQRVGDLSDLMDSRNTPTPISVEAEKQVWQEVHDKPVVVLGASQSAVSYDGRVTAVMPNVEELGDETHSGPFLNDVSTSRGSRTGDVEHDMGGYHTLDPSNAKRTCSPRHNMDASQYSHPKNHSNHGNVVLTSVIPTDPSNALSFHNASPPHELIPFPSLQPPSALPSDPPLDSSIPLQMSSAAPDEYSWEWGGFPQRSQVHIEFPALSDTAPLNPHDPEADGQLPVIQPTEFHRSKSLPPEFEHDVLEGIPSMSLPSDGQPNGQEPLSDVEIGFDHDSGMSGRERRSWVRWWRRDSRHSRSVNVRLDRPALKSAVSTPFPSESREASSRHVSTPDECAREMSNLSLPASSLELPGSMDPSLSGRRRSVKYAKTLRLTSEQLEALNLRPGANTITFSLSASGVVACAARIFMWEHTDRLVVSDIDGTITKSDALGHVFNLIGRDWTHLGVAKLYTDIHKNGYKIMYLTSRAIGQADSTRYYLQGIKQNDYQLPEGPVIMSPDRLMASLHREVIMRKPEVFKMACLRDIQRLFGPAAPLPFYAGFGNRITDALSYRSVNIPSSRIFTIDSNGEVKMELLDLVGHKSESVRSYIHMTDLVDQMFPPITHKWESEFTDNNYWKTPLAEFPLPDLVPPSPALSARSDVSNQSAFARLRNFSLRSTSSSRSRSFASSPPIEDRRGRDIDNTGSHGHQRQLSSIERLSNVFVGLASRSASPSTPSAQESESEEDRGPHDASDYAERRRRLRKRSTRSMPGSLPGSRPSSDDEDLEFGVMDKGADDPISDPAAELVEQEFDEDLFAAGEMQNVPFL